MKRKCLSSLSVGLLAALFVVVLAAAALAADFPSRPFEVIAPGGAGGGWDTTARLTAKVLGETGLITQPMPVINKPGGGGGVGLAYMQKKKGDPYTLIVYSPPLLLINLTGQTNLSFRDVTPLAMLINDFGAFAVPKNSPYQTIGDVMEALKKDPKSVKTGGNSSFGSMDHIQFLQAAKAAGVENIKDIPYIAFQEGPMAALMGGHIDLLSTGMAETVGPLEAGEIRVLALTSSERVDAGVLGQVPTLKESGIDTAFINWRGFFGAPGLGEAEKAHLVEAMQKMTATAEWDDVCAKNGWTKAFMGSEDFAAFLAKTEGEYKDLLTEIGIYKAQ